MSFFIAKLSFTIRARFARGAALSGATVSLEGLVVSFIAVSVSLNIGDLWAATVQIADRSRATAKTSFHTACNALLR
jgi:hypothetical protein